LKSAVLQYANALADIALEQGAAEPLLKQLGEFRTLFGESAELRNFLASPAIARAAKHDVIEKIAAQAGAGKVLRNFLFVLVDHQRTHILPEIAAALEEVLRQRRGIAQADVTSAAELSAAQKKELQQTLERVTGKKIEPSYALDAALLGGAVVRVGSTVYDGSVRNRLERLRARLASE
jgi:F-type H+-transporting ATPase subunit delta